MTIVAESSADVELTAEELIAQLPSAGDYPDWPTLTGRQEATNHSAFPGSEVRGRKAELLGTRIGLKLMPWQRDTLNEWLRTRPNGNWTHPSCCLIVPRQSGKSELLILRCLYGLLARGEKIIFTTQRWETALELGERMIAMINDRPSLKRRLATKPTTSQGRVIIKTKAKLREDGTVQVPAGKIAFATRSNDAGRGFTKVDLIVYDEAYNLTSGQRSALAFTQMAADSTQKIYTSSAVDELEHPKGHALAGIRRRGLAKGRGLAFREYMAPAALPWDSLEAARYACPSYGVIQTDDKITEALDEVTSLKDQRAYENECLGRGHWPKDPDKRSSVIPKQTWTDMIAPPEMVLHGSIVLAVDRSYGGDREWAIVAAQRAIDGRVHLDVGWCGSTTRNAQMIGMLQKCIDVWDPVALIIDRKSPAAVLEPLLISAGIEPVMTNTPQMAVACRGFLDDATDEQLYHAGQTWLTNAALGATQRFMPQGDFAWGRDSAAIAPLVGGTLARWGLLEFEIDGAGTLPDVPAGNTTQPAPVDPMWTPDDDFDALEAAF
ncbi:hypothetical protein SEA_OPIE_2 [Gordonia phage Opie]|nr:hypothetical protein SEA_OPIE_2 [Gordonia phage Opie]